MDYKSHMEGVDRMEQILSGFKIMHEYFKEHKSIFFVSNGHVPIQFESYVELERVMQDLT